MYVWIAVSVLIVAIVVPLIAALFVKKHFSVEKEIVIDRPKQEVFEFIKHLKNHEKFSKWFVAGADRSTRAYRGTDGTVGFVLSWSSDNRNVGVGEQEITKIVEGERIDTEIRFTKPFRSKDPAYIVAESLPNHRTRVKMGYHGKMNYPTNLICPAIAKKIGQDMEASLMNLKRVLETR